MNIEKRTLTPEVIGFEENFPEMASEFLKIMDEEYGLFVRKQLNYGKGNIMLGGDINNYDDRNLAISGIVIRLSDKINRLITLVLKNKKDNVNESVIDSFQDICNYSIIAQMVINKTWK